MNEQFVAKEPCYKRAVIPLRKEVIIRNMDRISRSLSGLEDIQSSKVLYYLLEILHGIFLYSFIFSVFILGQKLKIL